MEREREEGPTADGCEMRGLIRGVVRGRKGREREKREEGEGEEEGR